MKSLPKARCRRNLGVMARTPAEIRLARHVRSGGSLRQASRETRRYSGTFRDV